MRKALSLVVLFVVGMLLTTAVQALDSSNLNWKEFEINGHDFDANENIVFAVEEGDVLDLTIGLVAATGANDVEVDAKISGFEYADKEGKLSASTELFDLAAGTTKYVDLQLQLPKSLDKEQYTLRLRVTQKNGAAFQKDITLAVEPTRHGVEIADVTFSPGNTVKAGRSLLTTVLLENYGDKDEKDVKVTVAIPQLGVSATEFVDLVETDNNNVEFEDVPEMFLPVPATAAAGDYQVVVTVSYDNYFESVSKTYTVKVVENEMFQKSDKLVLAVGPETQSVQAGQKAVYQVALANEGASSKAYTLTAVTGDWATTSLSENLVVLEPGKTKVITVEVYTNSNAPVGDHVVSLAINSGAEVLETVSLKATVLPGKATSGVSLRNGLEIALIVLVVLLVIVGLIIGFSRLRRDDEEEEQTYY